jgi:hypothetical protein
MYEAHLPWFTKVFVAYLALVLLLSAARAISLIRRLRTLRTLEQETATELTSNFPVILGVSLCQNRRDKEPIRADLVAVPTININGVEHDADSGGSHDGEINRRGITRRFHG